MPGSGLVLTSKITRFYESVISFPLRNPCQEQAGNTRGGQWPGLTAKRERPQGEKCLARVWGYMSSLLTQNTAPSPSVISNFSVETFAFKLLCSSRKHLVLALFQPLCRPHCDATRADVFSQFFLVGQAKQEEEAGLCGNTESPPTFQK